MGFLNSKKEITEAGFDYEDVRVFMSILSLSDSDFLKSKSLRTQYLAWEQGKVFMFGRKMSSSGGGEEMMIASSI